MTYSRGGSDYLSRSQKLISEEEKITTIFSNRSIIACFSVRVLPDIQSPAQIVITVVKVPLLLSCYLARTDSKSPVLDLKSPFCSSNLLFACEHFGIILKSNLILPTVSAFIYLRTIQVFNPNRLIRIRVKIVVQCLFRHWDYNIYNRAVICSVFGKFKEKTTQ